MALEQYDVWVDGKPVRRPVAEYDRVQIKSYGGGVSQQLIGETGTVIKINRTKVAVEIEPGRDPVACWPGQLTLLSRQRDRACPVEACKAAPGQPCGSSYRGVWREQIMLHRAR